MPAERNRRGSVLLMAIGLLTIIAILASTFLIVSNLDSQEQAILSIKDQSDPLAQGAFKTVVSLALKDLWCDDDGNDGPFGANEGLTGVHAWQQYIDSPLAGERPKPADPNRIDAWLAREYDDADGASFPIRQPFTRINASTDNVANVPNADLDGDKILDAVKYKPYPDADISQPEYKFWMAVRVVDLAGKICLNTAGYLPTSAQMASPGAPLSRSPVLINLKQLLTQTAYDALDRERCNKQSKSLREFDTGCGRRLLMPHAAFKPFDIGDELFLLWCERLTPDTSAYVGRLYDTIGSDLIQANGPATPGGLPGPGDEAKRSLTTFSCTSARVRHPKVGEFERLTYLDLRDPNRDEIDQAIYNRAVRMISELKLTSDSSGDPCGSAIEQRMAAHFTANLRAYITPMEFARTSWPTFERDSVKYYGVKQDVVISEVFAKHFAKEAPDPNNEKETWGWGCAVELTNPSGINLNTGEFELWVGDSKLSMHSAQIPGGLSGNSFGKVVLYNFAKGDDASDANVNPDKLFGVPTAGWYQVPDMDFVGEGDRKVSLRRVVGSGSFVVDEAQLRAEGLNYKRKGNRDELEPESKPDQPVVCDMRRDDRHMVTGASGGVGNQALRARYNVGVWRRKEDRSGGVIHALGSNNVPGNEPDNWLTTGGGAVPSGKGAVYSAPIYQSDRAPGDVASQLLLLDSSGDLCNVYFCGPSSDLDGGFPQRILRDEDSTIFRDDAISGPSRGRLDFASPVSHGGYAAGSYPDVPPGSLFAEFFTNVPPDEERKREKSRIYGLVNVNAAPGKVLRALPWPDGIRVPEGAPELPAINDTEKNKIVARLIAYREQPTSGLVDGSRRNSTSVKAYLTPGEVAIPLAAYTDNLMQEQAGGANIDELRKRADYVWTRNYLYKSIADCVTTRSDVFAVYIMVQNGTSISSSRYKWHYIGVFDRSNVLKRTHAPATLMFTQINVWDTANNPKP